VKIIVHPRWRVSGTMPGQKRRNSATVAQAANPHLGVGVIATGERAERAAGPADTVASLEQPDTAAATKTERITHRATPIRPTQLSSPHQNYGAAAASSPNTLLFTQSV
jgi:hypothetical protein